MRKRLLVFFACFYFTQVFAQNLSVETYINTYKDMAIREQKRMGVPAAITLAQGLLETENGNSDLVRRSNNHFGIKCKSTWRGEFVYHDDDELGECFRKYGSAEESYRDHSDFLRCNKRYAFLFDLKPNDYKGWAYGLKKAGYATNPRYPDILIRHIEQYELYKYDQEGEDEFTDTLALAQVLSEQMLETNSSANDSLKSVVTEQPTTYNNLAACYAEKGTSLLALATKYDLPLSKLMEYNDLQKDGLLARDSWIYLERKKKTGLADTYTSNQVESLYDIAQKTGVQLNSLLIFNGLNDGALVKKGAVLRLKPIPVPQSLVPADESCVHRVQKGEGLYGIAKKYGITLDELRSWNNINTNELRVGQVLIISK